MSYGRTTDVELSVTTERQGQDPRTVDTRSLGTLTAGDSITVRLSVTFSRGPTRLRAAILGRPAASEAVEGVAAHLYALVYPDEAVVSSISMAHARRDSLRAHRGVLGRLFGWGEESLAEERITTDNVPRP